MSSNRTRAGGPPLRQDPGCGFEDARGRVRRPDAPGVELGRGGPAVSREDEDRDRADGQPELDVDGLVADHERCREIEPELAGGPDPQAGLRRGAGTGLSGDVRRVGAGIDGIETGPAAGELLFEAPMQGVELS